MRTICLDIEAIMRPHTNNRFVFAQLMLDGGSNNGLPRVKTDSVSSYWLAKLFIHIVRHLIQIMHTLSEKFQLHASDT